MRKPMRERARGLGVADKTFQDLDDDCDALVVEFIHIAKEPNGRWEARVQAETNEGSRTFVSKKRLNLSEALWEAMGLVMSNLVGSESSEDP